MLKIRRSHRPSYLKHGNPHTWERQSLYWDGARISITSFFSLSYYIHWLQSKHVLAERHFNNIFRVTLYKQLKHLLTIFYCQGFICTTAWTKRCLNICFYNTFPKLDLGCGLLKLHSLIYPRTKFSILQKYLQHINFDWVAAIPVKYERYIRQLIPILAMLKTEENSGTEESGSVTPTPWSTKCEE